MTVNFVGSQKLDFISSDGKQIKGTNLYVTYPANGVEGLKTDKFFLKNEIALPDFKANEKLEVYFNQRGKVEFIEKA